ncbi:hypothetical protein ACLOJK_038218 [Asimina triloba]
MNKGDTKLPKPPDPVSPICKTSPSEDKDAIVKRRQEESEISRHEKAGSGLGFKAESHEETRATNCPCEPCPNPLPKKLDLTSRRRGTMPVKSG